MKWLGAALTCTLCSCPGLLSPPPGCSAPVQPACSPSAPGSLGQTVCWSSPSGRICAQSARTDGFGSQWWYQSEKTTTEKTNSCTVDLTSYPWNQLLLLLFPLSQVLHCHLQVVLDHLVLPTYRPSQTRKRKHFKMHLMQRDGSHQAAPRKTICSLINTSRHVHPVGLYLTASV